MRISKNPKLNALAKTVLCGASFHLLLLIIYTIQHHQWDTLNIFNILDIDLFLPQSAKGVFNYILSYAIFLGIYLYFFLKHKEK